MSDTAQNPLSALSWNIHRGRGNDGHVDPERTLDVLSREVWIPGAEVLVLQEADEEVPPYRGVLDVARVEHLTGLRWVHSDRAARSSEVSHGFLGMMAFVHPRLEIEAIRLVDLPGVCPRGAVVVDIVRSGAPVRVVTTHLSLSQALRIVQLRTISQHLKRFDARPTVLMGDLNEWRPWGGLALSPRMIGHRFEGPCKATFPIKRPLLPLDRALTTGQARVAEVTVLDGPGIRAVSDHRPIHASIDLMTSQ